jgi:hypothetical protein
MSTINRRARRAAERELKRLERRLATDPSRPILRAPERHSRDCGAGVPPAPSSPLPSEDGPAKGGDEPASVTPGGRGSRRASSPLPPGAGPGRGGEESTTPRTASSSVPQFAIRNPLYGSPGVPDSANPINTPPPNDGSLFPLWARLLTLPPDLDPTYRAFLFRYINDHIAPSDDHEHWLAARIATAMARLHLNASREPESPSPAWLRYEALADRQLRQAHRDLKTHRATQPPPPSPQSDIRNPISAIRSPRPAISPQSAQRDLRAPALIVPRRSDASPTVPPRPEPGSTHPEPPDPPAPPRFPHA